MNELANLFRPVCFHSLNILGFAQPRGNNSFSNDQIHGHEGVFDGSKQLGKAVLENVNRSHKDDHDKNERKNGDGDAAPKIDVLDLVKMKLFLFHVIFSR